MVDSHGYLERVFAIFARHQISVDVVATSEVSVSMTFDPCERSVLESAVEEIGAFAEVEYEPNRSILCLVGAASEVCKSFKDNHLRILSRIRQPHATLARQGVSESM